MLDAVLLTIHFVNLQHCVTMDASLGSDSCSSDESDASDDAAYEPQEGDLLDEVGLGMRRGSFPKFPIGNFPEISERKFRYLSGIIPFFIITFVYIRSVSHKAWACR